jgi:hypothetical protein
MPRLPSSGRFESKSNHGLSSRLAARTGRGLDKSVTTAPAASSDAHGTITAMDSTAVHACDCTGESACRGDCWNSHDPVRVSLAEATDSICRNRHLFLSATAKSRSSWLENGNDIPDIC